MAKIAITDKLGAELITADTLPGSGIAKYFRADVARFYASAELAQALATPLADLEKAPLGLALNFAEGGVFGTSGADWKFGAGARVSVVPAGGTVTVAFSPSLSASAGASPASGLKFGFAAGGTVEFRASRDFADPARIRLKDALLALLSSGVVPGNVLDVQAMPAGDAAAVAGSGNLKVSAKFDIARAMNPLAVPGMALGSFAKLELNAGMSVSVGASLSLRGSYEVQVRKKTASTVAIEYRKTAASQFQLDVRSAVGTSLDIFGTDVLPKLLGFLSKDPQAEGLGELPQAQQTEIASAVTASVNRTLELSLAASLASERQNIALFAYEFDLDRLDAAGVAALNAALQADLTPLTGVFSTALPQGVRMVRSALEEIEKRSVQWKLNLLGIVNVTRLSELVRRGKVLFEAQSGELIITDSVTAKRLAVAAMPLMADAEKVRHLLLQSMMVTAAYRASGAAPVASELSGSIRYFEQSANANAATVADYLDNLMGCGLIDNAERQTFLQAGFAAGRASVLLEAAFADTHFRAMFLDGAGKARKQEEYETIGRDAIAAIIQPEEDDAFRRLPMLTGDAKSNTLWRKMTEGGQTQIAQLVPKAYNSGVHLQMLVGDYSIVRWWAKSMRDAAKQVEAMDAYLAKVADRSAEALAKDAEFAKRRRDMSKALADVANDSLPGFLDAWGVVSLYAAAGGAAESLRGMVMTASGGLLVRQKPMAAG